MNLVGVSSGLVSYWIKDLESFGVTKEFELNVLLSVGHFWVVLVFWWWWNVSW